MINHHPQQPDVSDDEYSVVLIGDFNPTIYQPAWFASQELLRKLEAKLAKIEIIHADRTSFSTEWFDMEVTREKFSVAINSPEYRRHLQDLISNTLRTLSHTPLRHMWINYSALIRFNNPLDRHCFGHFLLPKSPWAGLLPKPCMRIVSVDFARPDNLTGRVVVEVVPVQDVANEAKVHVYDHCECPHDRQVDGAGFFLELLDTEYDHIVDRSKALVDGLLERFCAQSTFDDGAVE